MHDSEILPLFVSVKNVLPLGISLCNTGGAQ